MGYTKSMLLHKSLKLIQYELILKAKCGIIALGMYITKDYTLYLEKVELWDWHQSMWSNTFVAIAC